MSASPQLAWLSPPPALSAASGPAGARAKAPFRHHSFNSGTDVSKRQFELSTAYTSKRDMRAQVNNLCRPSRFELGLRAPQILRKTPDLVLSRSPQRSTDLRSRPEPYLHQHRGNFSRSTAMSTLSTFYKRGDWSIAAVAVAAGAMETP